MAPDAPPPFQRILVGLDPEGDATHAVLRANALASELDARVRYVHAVDVRAPVWPEVLLADHETWNTAALAHARETQQTSVTAALAEAGIERTEDPDALRVHAGPAAHVLRQEVRDFDADLLVLGPHVRRSVFDFGSTLRAIVGHLETPLWIQPCPPTEIRTVALATDFSPHADRATELAEALATRWGAELIVVHACDVPTYALMGAEGMAVPAHVVDKGLSQARERLDRLVEGQRRAGLSAEPVFVEGSALEGILSVGSRADLIVMGTHGRTGLSRFLLGSTAHGVLARAEQPVLVVPAAETDWLLAAGGE